MRFQARLFDAATATVREVELEADTLQAAQALAREQAGVVLSVQPQRALPGLARRTAAALDIAWWCRELRTLVAAGMTVVEALETLHAQTAAGARHAVQAALVQHLREGKPLSDAMAATRSFPQVLVAGVRASERTSSLIDALDEYLRYHDMLDRLRKQVVSAAIYPAVVVALGLVITVFLLMFVIPRFSGMYADLQGPVSWTTAALVGLSKLLNQHGALVATGLAIMGVGLIAAWQRGWVQQGAARIAAGIGPLQRQIDEFRLAKLYHSLALMFRGGYALDDALAQCAGLGLGGRLSAGVQQAVQALSRGEGVSRAFSAAGLTDHTTVRLLAVGERSGNFDRVLHTIAERHSANFTLFVERATRIVEPLLLMAVALVVGGIVVMMYMPVFDIATSIR